MHNQTQRWLLTNGLGAYSLGSATGYAKTAEEALLIAVMRPPLQRSVVVRSLRERAHVDGQWLDLQAPSPNTPVAFEYDVQWRMPVFRHALGPFELRKTLWMSNREPAVYVQYAWPRQAPELRLQVSPGIPCSPDAKRSLHKDHIQQHGERGFAFKLESDDHKWLYCSFDQPARFALVNQWQRIELHMDEGAQTEWLYLPAALEIRIPPGESITLRLGLDNPAFFDGAEKWQHTLEQHRMIVEKLPKELADATLATLALSAEQYIVERATRISRHSLTLLAGYPGHTDDGWETLIALPGVLLSLKFVEKARRVLAMLKDHARPGVLPGRFPAGPGEPADSRLDAGLWYFNAVYEFWLATKDRHFLQQEYPFLIQLLNAYMAGTEHGVRMDAEDGLLKNNWDSPARTWMHRRIGEWEVTPRIGKAVEVQALWYNAVKILHEISVVLGNEAGVEKTAALATRIEASIRKRFWLEKVGYLADVIHDDGVDTALRPNQVLAVGLPYCPLSEAKMQRLLEAIDRQLLTPYGLRTLSPEHPAYCGRAGRTPHEQASAWFNGTVHPWMTWPYVGAALRAGRPPHMLLEQFSPLFDSIEQDLFGHLPEAFEGDPPHRPVGVPASLLSLAAALQSYWILKSLEQGG